MTTMMMTKKATRIKQRDKQFLIVRIVISQETERENITFQGNLGTEKINKTPNSFKKNDNSHPKTAHVSKKNSNQVSRASSISDKKSDNPEQKKQIYFKNFIKNSHPTIAPPNPKKHCSNEKSSENENTKEFSTDTWQNKNLPYDKIYKNRDKALEYLQKAMDKGKWPYKTHNNISKRGNSQAFKLIENMQLCEIFDKNKFLQNLKKLPSTNEKKDFIDIIVCLRTLNKKYGNEFKMSRVEPMLRRFVRNLKENVKIQKEERNQKLRYYFLNEFKDLGSRKNSQMSSNPIIKIFKNQNTSHKKIDIKVCKKNTQPLIKPSKNITAEMSNALHTIIESQDDETLKNDKIFLNSIYDLILKKTYQRRGPSNSNEENLGNKFDKNSKFKRRTSDTPIYYNENTAYNEILRSKKSYSVCGNYNPDQFFNNNEVIEMRYIPEKSIKNESSVQKNPSLHNIENFEFIKVEQGNSLTKKASKSVMGALDKIILKQNIINNSETKRNSIEFGSNKNIVSQAQRLKVVRKSVDLCSNQTNNTENILINNSKEMYLPNNNQEDETKSSKDAKGFTIHRRKVDDEIREFLMKYPEAKSKIVGNNFGKTSIASPRLIKKRMANFVNKSEKRFQNLNNILIKGAQIESKKEEENRHKKGRKTSVSCSKNPFKNYQPKKNLISNKTIFGSEFKLIDIINAKQTLTYDLMKFLLQNNDKKTISTFQQLDKTKAYTNHLLDNFEEVFEIADKFARKDYQKTKLQKTGQKIPEKMTKNISYNFNKIMLPSSENHINNQIKYQTSTVRNFKNLFHKNYSNEDFFNVTGQNLTCCNQKNMNSKRRSVTLRDFKGITQGVLRTTHQERVSVSKIQFAKNNIEKGLICEDNESDNSMGDVDELKYDNLYTRSVVLRSKLDKLLAMNIGEKGILIEVLKALVEELADLSDQIKQMIYRVFRDEF